MTEESVFLVPVQLFIFQIPAIVLDTGDTKTKEKFTLPSKNSSSSVRSQLVKKCSRTSESGSVCKVVSLTFECTVESPGRLVKTRMPEFPSQRLIYLVLGVNLVSRFLKAPHVIPMCRQGWTSLTQG